MIRIQHLVFFSTYLSTCVYSQLLPDNAPDKSQPGQSGTNRCGTQSSQSSMCQNAFVNSVDDFCLYAPPEPGPGSVIGNTERIEVAWCTKDGKGTRLIPDGAITGAHFIQTPDFVQITGIGDLTKLNVPAADEGGELDPHGADGNGNPIGGLVFSSAFGQLQQIKEWTNFMSDTMFCFRACKPGPRAAEFCQHIYDVMGCEWNMPAEYGAGFDSCRANSGEPMGVYGGSTFHQGEPVTPDAHPRPASSACVKINTIGNGAVIQTPAATTSPATGPATAPTAPATTTATATSPPAVGSSSGTTRTGILTNPPASSTPAGASAAQTNSAQSATTSSSSAPPALVNGIVKIGSAFTVGIVAAFFFF